MLKKIERRKAVLSFVFVIFGGLAALYCYAAAIRDAYLCSVLSLACAAVSGLVFLFAAISAGTGSGTGDWVNTDPGNKVGLLYYVSAAACFSWTVADIFWISDLSRGLDPTQDVAASFWYLMPNVVFGSATLVFALRQNSRWLSVKSIFESVSVGLLSVIFIWIVEFNGEEAFFYAQEIDGLVTLILIVIDGYMLAQLLLLLTAADKKSMPACFVLTGAGYFLYAAADLACYICGYNGAYDALFILGGLYAFSFAIAAAGALTCALRRKPAERIKYRDYNTRYRWIYLMIFPSAAMLLRGFDIIQMFIFGVFIGLYQVAARYIRLSEHNEKLLMEERDGSARYVRRIEEQDTLLTALTNRDTVTNLYNRRYFTACLEKTIRQLRHNEIVAVVQFDIDRFKAINDSYGHDYGDKVIVEIANRLADWNSCGAVISRIGGDEFAVMLSGCYSRYDIGEYCKQIIGLCSSPVFVDAEVLYITISAGISLCPNDAGDCAALLMNADISMYKAKEEGYNKYVFYSPVFNENIHRKNEIESLLRKADVENDFELVFQPQFELPGRRLIGAEALIRWKSAEHGYIPPGVFIPIAEEINFIGRIGAWVLRRAVEQIIRWNTEYGLDLKMCVNISPRQLTEKSFFSTMKTLISESGVNPAWLDAEITENLMIEEKTKVKPIFSLFQELNISVSIDDFGSGYSSLGYLNRFHFDRIKIDKSLIDNLLLPGGSGVEVVKAIISMACAVGKLTIAEGVEKQEQLKILEELGCRQIQGYLFGRPVPADEFAARHIREQITKKKDEGGKKGKTMR